MAIFITSLSLGAFYLVALASVPPAIPDDTVFALLLIGGIIGGAASALARVTVDLLLNGTLRQINQ